MTYKTKELNELDTVGSVCIECYTSEKVKQVAYLLLLETDYTALSDIALDNATEFAEYRASLRNVMKSDLSAYAFPRPPEPQWTVIEANPE